MLGNGNIHNLPVLDPDLGELEARLSNFLDNVGYQLKDPNDDTHNPDLVTEIRARAQCYGELYKDPNNSLFLAEIRDTAKSILDTEAPPTSTDNKKAPTSLKYRRAPTTSDSIFRYEEAVKLYEKVIEVLVNINLRLVVSAANNRHFKYRFDPAFTLEDSIGEAMFYMWRAAIGWDPTRGKSLGSYFAFLYHRDYKQKIRNVIDPFISGGSRSLQKDYQLWKMYSVLREENPDLTNEMILLAIAEKHHIPPEKIRAGIKAYANYRKMRNALSGDETPDDNHRFRWEFIPGNHEIDPENMAFSRDENLGMVVLDELKGHFSEVNVGIVSRIWGLDGRDQISAEQVAKSFEVSVTFVHGAITSVIKYLFRRGGSIKLPDGTMISLADLFLSSSYARNTSRYTTAARAAAESYQGPTVAKKENK